MAPSKLISTRPRSPRTSSIDAVPTASGEPHGAAGELIGPHGGRREHELAVEVEPELIAVGRVLNHPPVDPAVTVEEEVLGASE
jgi:hypothetical protein